MLAADIEQILTLTSCQAETQVSLHQPYYDLMNSLFQLLPKPLYRDAVSWVTPSLHEHN